MAYEVTAVAEQTRQWASQKGGAMVSYRVHLKDGQGNESQNVEWSRKASSAPPRVGEQVEGNIDNTDYGLKLKPAFAAAGGGRGMSPEDRKSIVRQHSQQMALTALELAATWGVVDKPADTRAFFELVEKTTTWFVKDAGKDAA